jgi:hypothetical protein
VRALVATGLLLTTTLSLAVFGADARADNPDPGALFDRGLAEMQAHQYATGCPDIAESYKLEPHAGGLFTLAECEAQWGKIASAIADYDGFLDTIAHLPPPDRIKQQARTKLAAEKRTALFREVPRVTLSLESDTTPGTTVTLDGKAVPEASMQTALPVDPGDHTILLRTPDGRTKEQHVTVSVGETKAVPVGIAPIVVAGPVPAPDQPTPTPDLAPEGAKPSARNKVVIATAAVGGAAVVGGLVLGVVVLSQKSSIETNCPGSVCATQADANSANSTKTLGWISTGVVAGGGAVLAAAGIIRLMWPKAESASVTPSVEPSTTGAIVGLHGVW